MPDFHGPWVSAGILVTASRGCGAVMGQGGPAMAMSVAANSRGGGDAGQLRLGGEAAKPSVWPVTRRR